MNITFLDYEELYILSNSRQYGFYKRDLLQYVRNTSSVYRWLKNSVMLFFSETLLRHYLTHTTTFHYWQLLVNYLTFSLVGLTMKITPIGITQFSTLPLWRQKLETFFRRYILESIQKNINRFIRNLFLLAKLRSWVKDMQLETCLPSRQIFIV